MSTEYAFTTSPSAASPYPMRLGIIADLGETANSTQTVQHLIDDKPQFVTLIGDLTCAHPFTLQACIALCVMTQGKQLEADHRLHEVLRPAGHPEADPPLSLP